MRLHHPTSTSTDSSPSSTSTASSPTTSNDRLCSVPDPTSSIPTSPAPAPEPHDITPPEYDYTAAVAVLTLHKGSTLRIAGIDDRVALALRETCSKAWPLGVQDAHWNAVPSLVPLHYKLTFKGTPWESPPAYTVKVRQLVCAMLRTLLAHGWRLEATSDLSRSPLDKDTMVFLRAAPHVVAEGDMFSVSLHSTDRLRVIDAPADVESALRQTVAAHWPAGVQEVKQVLDSLELKLHGNPWFGHLNHSITPRFMLAKVLARLKNMGYTLYSSVDISRGVEGQDLDTWIFIRNLPRDY